MSFKEKGHIFLYHAYAVPAGGWVKAQGTRQYSALETVAPAALSVSGGYASASAHNVNYRAYGQQPYGKEGPPEFLVHIGHAYGEVRGVEEDDVENPNGVYRTTVRSVLDDFRINDVIAVEHLEAVLVSTHEKPDRNGRKREGKVVVRGSNMSGLRVVGKHIGLKNEEHIDDVPTHGELRDHIDQHMAAAKASTAAENGGGADWLPAFCDWNDLYGPNDKMPPYAQELASIRSDTHLRCSIFSEVDAPAPTRRTQSGTPDMVPYKASIFVPRFGRIFIGEVIVSRGMKQLNMLRLDLGCDNCGGYTGGGGTTNGETMP